MNSWKVATIVLGIFCLCLLGWQMYQDSKIVNIQGMEISESDLGKFMNVTGEDQAIKICDLENKICRVVQWRAG